MSLRGSAVLRIFAHFGSLMIPKRQNFPSIHVKIRYTVPCNPTGEGRSTEFAGNVQIRYMGRFRFSPEDHPCHLTVAVCDNFNFFIFIKVVPSVARIRHGGCLLRSNSRHDPGLKDSSGRRETYPGAGRMKNNKLSHWIRDA